MRDPDKSRFLKAARHIETAEVPFVEVDPDIYEIKRIHGVRMALHGNIDVAGVLAAGTPGDVAADTVEHMRRLASGGGYIVGSSHDLGVNIPLENFCAMRDAVHGYRHGRCE